MVEGVIGAGERPRRRYVFYALLFCAFSACLVFALWWRWANVTPRFAIPAPPLPPQNAYDFWVEAAAEIRPADATLLRTALREAPASQGGEANSLSATDRKIIIQRNAAALAGFHEGLRHPYGEPTSRSMASTFSHYTQFRQLARLARLEGLERAERGDYAGAMDRALDGIQMGVEIPHGAPNIGLLTGAAFQREARIDAWPLVARLTPAEAQKAAQRLEQICARQVPYWRTLEDEKWFGVASVLELVQKPNWRTDLQQLRLGTPSGFPRSAGEALVLARLSTISKSELVRNYASHMDHLITLARGPYPGGAVDFPRAPEVTTERLVAVFDVARFGAVKEESLNGLLLLSLALQAYHGEHGRYPATLKELTPTHLKTIPNDPFDLRLGYRYEREGKTYRLYSVGPDLQDNHCAPARSRSIRGKGSLSPLYKPDRRDSGDLVPGVNL